MKSKKSLIIIVVVILAALWAVSYSVKSYNQMVVLDEETKTAWSQVQNQYQRRGDLIPNLVNTVKGYAAHESETLEKVIQARASATQTTISPDNLTPEAMQQYIAAQGEISQALSRLLVSVERYPELKANENFLTLQAQLEGTENRISTERNRFNEAARVLNTYVRTFPRNIVANIFGIQQRPYFEAAAGNEQAPNVQF